MEVTAVPAVATSGLLYFIVLTFLRHKLYFLILHQLRTG